MERIQEIIFIKVSLLAFLSLIKAVKEITWIGVKTINIPYNLKP